MSGWEACSIDLIAVSVSILYSFTNTISLATFTFDGQIDFSFLYYSYKSLDWNIWIISYDTEIRVYIKKLFFMMIRRSILLYQPDHLLFFTPWWKHDILLSHTVYYVEKYGIVSRLVPTKTAIFWWRQPVVNEWDFWTYGHVLYLENIF